MRTQKAKKEHNPFRLGRDIVPVSYDIELTPDLDQFTFQGQETISFLAQKPFSGMTLHAIDLKITNAYLLRGELESGSRLFYKHIRYNEKFETVEIQFGETLKPGQYNRLVIEFEGELNDRLQGFYRTSYEVDGQKRWGAATQFEATDARRCFPCWDEPEFKAEFKVTLNVPAHLTALSNMPAIREEMITGRNLKKVSYDVTPRMSTYLLAFVIADLDYIEAMDQNGVLIRIFTTPGKIEQGKFALDVALHTLPYFSEWFGIPYALPKCDMVALPDFAAGAMENWGLVTYRETALLVDPVNSSAAARQRVAEVIDHELAHQWFGNLVTMEWWTDLWLNEGFASYMGPKAVDHQFPKWKVWNQYVGQEYVSALHSDSLKNTHPIEIPVKNPYEIREIFDGITYNKGSVVNRMLEHFLGEEHFREGLRIYLNRYAYGNAKTDQLWEALEEVSGKPVKTIMASYTRQEGYPFLKVEQKENGKNMVLRLEQNRFVFDGSKAKSSANWGIPLTVQVGSSKKPVVEFMKKKNETLALPSADGKYVKINPGQSGFFRVAYPEPLLDRLKTAIAANRLSHIDCLGILDDAFALSRAGQIKTSEALDILKNLKDSTDYNVWAHISHALGAVETVFGEKEIQSRLNPFGQKFYASIMRKMGWNQKPSDSHLDILLRSLVIAAMGHYDDPSVIQQARKRFEAFVKTGKLDPNLRMAVYSITARNGGPVEFEKLVSIYKQTNLQEERVRVLRAMTRFRKKEVIMKALNFALSEGVRSQDSFVILSGFGGNSAGRDLAWKFIKSSWKELNRRYSGGNVSLLGRILEGATSSYSSKAALKDVGQFFKAHPVQGTERTMKQSLEVIASNHKWNIRSKNDVAAWLKNNN